jgi:hypothetical protein
MSPYRSEIRSHGGQGLEKHDCDGLLTITGLFWLASVVRVVGGIVHGEVFGGEATLALIAIIGIPWILLGDHTGE